MINNHKWTLYFKSSVKDVLFKTHRIIVIYVIRLPVILKIVEYRWSFFSIGHKIFKLESYIAIIHKYFKIIY